jgi:hypothetical protein
MFGMSLKARRRLLRTVALLTVATGVHVFAPVWNQFHTHADSVSLRRSSSSTRHAHESEVSTHANASLPLLERRPANSDAFRKDWSCMSVNGRTVLYSHTTPGVKGFCASEERMKRDRYYNMHGSPCMSQEIEQSLPSDGVLNRASPPAHPLKPPVPGPAVHARDCLHVCVEPTRAHAFSPFHTMPSGYYVGGS